MRHRSPLSVSTRRHAGRGRLGWALLALAAASAQAESGMTEDDFFDPMPVVLTATRLAQPLSDTPGAVTVIDRETIRRSGARTLADVLRLVPGYVVSGYNGANPVAAYHAPIDDFGTRNLVLIDGRSLYSSTYFGGTTRGMAAVALEDVERIEVLRGSNSAAYGANALFGVINVITRHALDTLGRSVSVTQGQSGVSDAHVRLGWGDAGAAQRLSFAQRRDSGYAFVNDDTRLNTLTWRGDFQWRPDMELSLQAGVAQNVIGEGISGQRGNPARDVRWSNRYLSAQFTQRQSDHEQSQWSFAWDQDTNSDSFYYANTPIILGSDYSDSRLNLEFQHQKAWSDKFRAVWGFGWRQDRANSSALFFDDQQVQKRDVRVFGHAEWAFSPDWLLNAGLFLGNDTVSGYYAAPRLMFNYRIDNNQTFRFGSSGAERPPTLLESQSNVRAVIPVIFESGIPLLESRIKLKSEKLQTQEVGYYGWWPSVQLSADVRIFDEKFSRQIQSLEAYEFFLPPVLGLEPIMVNEFRNEGQFRVRGLEYQLKWEPTPGSRWVLNQAFTRLQRVSTIEERLPPSLSTTVGLMQQFPQDWDLTLLLHTRTGMLWRAADARLPNAQRLDMRVAKRFRWGGARAEAALTVQSLNGDQVEFTTKLPSVFERRAFVTLQLEF